MAAWLASPLAIIWLTVTVGAALVCRVWFSGRIGVAIFVLGGGSLFGLYPLTKIPLPADIALPQGSIVYDRDGEVIGSFSEVKRIIIDTSELPDHVIDAVVAAEDRGFYDHGGVSFTSIVRASLANLRSLEISQGGSTITQQYIKNAVLEDSSRTWTRKIREAVLAVKLEDRYTKAQILDFYLNTIYFGRGVYGIDAAARTYFAKPARRLSLGEAAFLAGIIRSPEHLQPDRNPGAARQRRDAVLTAMAEEGFVSRARSRAAARRPIVVPDHVDARSDRLRAGYFMEWMRRGVLEEHFGDCLYECGLQIHTTLDLDIQRHAERAVTDALHRRRDPEAALVAMTPRGEVLAFVGGRAVSDPVAAKGFNFASDYPGRHAGSALKPFTLVAALEAGVSPHVVLDGSSPRVVADPACSENGKRWVVENYGGATYGRMSLSSATAFSVNTAYAQLTEMVGPEAIARVVARFGFDRASTDARRKIPPLCSLALGAIDVTPLEMTRAYAGLAADGALPAVTPLSYVADETGRCIKAFTPRPGVECPESVAEPPARVAPAPVAAAATGVLEDVVAYGTGSGVDVQEVAAGKTGTSQNNTDAWFAGYTNELVSSVWVGYPATKRGIVPQMRRCPNRVRCRPVDAADVSGGMIPADIWETFMRAALAELAEPERGSVQAPSQLVGTPGGSSPLDDGRGHRGADEKPPPNIPTDDPGPPTPPPPAPDPDPGPLPIPLPSPTRVAPSVAGGTDAAPAGGGPGGFRPQSSNPEAAPTAVRWLDNALIQLISRLVLR